MKPVVFIIAFFAGGLVGVAFGCCAAIRPCDAQAAAMLEPVAVQPAAQPLVLSAEDAKLFERIRPLVSRHVDDKLKAVADELNGSDKLGAPVGGPWSVLGAALASFVKKAVAAAIFALILSALVSLLWAYWYWPAGVVAIWLATTALVSAIVAKSTKGKS